MKKALVILLTVVMVLALMPTLALAAGTTIVVSNTAELASALVSAASGDTIHLNNGSYTLAPKTTIDKDITITGESEAGVIITPSASTGSAGDNRAWLLVNAGGTLNIDSLTLDGTGFSIYQAIRVRGAINAENLTICNIKYPTYYGTGIAQYGGTSSLKNITMYEIGRVGIGVYANTTIDGFTYTGKGAGDWLDYGIEVGTVDRNTPAFSVDISSVTISNCLGVATVDGSESIGIIVSTYFYSTGGGIGPNLIDVAIDHADISNCSYGISVGYWDTVKEFSDTTITNSNFSVTNEDLIFFDGGTDASMIASGNYYGGSAPTIWTTAGKTIAGIDNYAAVPYAASKDTEVKAGVDPTYIIVIPSAVNFGTLVKGTGLKSQDFDVTAQNVLIETGASINVSVTSPFTMKDLNGAGSIPLAYTLASASNPGVVDGELFASFTESRVENGDIAVDTVGITKAGAYQGTMVFNISYID